MQIYGNFYSAFSNTAHMHWPTNLCAFMTIGSICNAMVIGPLRHLLSSSAAWWLRAGPLFLCIVFRRVMEGKQARHEWWHWQWWNLAGWWTRQMDGQRETPTDRETNRQGSTWAVDRWTTYIRIYQWTDRYRQIPTGIGSHAERQTVRQVHMRT